MHWCGSEKGETMSEQQTEKPVILEQRVYVRVQENGQEECVMVRADAEGVPVEFRAPVVHAGIYNGKQRVAQMSVLIEAGTLAEAFDKRAAAEKQAHEQAHQEFMRQAARESLLTPGVPPIGLHGKPGRGRP